METVDRFSARRVRRLGVPATAREVRLVHDLDGILCDAPPSKLVSAGDALWAAWLQQQRDAGPVQPDLLLGLDAGGILPTVALSLASGLPYRLAWKLDLDLPGKRCFSEPHAIRTEVFTYGDLFGRCVLLVDDEVTTGRTLANLIAVLRQDGVHLAGVACLIEDLTGDARSLLRSLGVQLCVLASM